MKMRGSTLAFTAAIAMSALWTSAQEGKHSFYSPDILLLAETAMNSAAQPQVEQEYVWFGSRPVAQFDGVAQTVRWILGDHFATPILQTSAAGSVAWRAEHEPYGGVFELRAGASLIQPLRFPGQHADATSGDRAYNVNRWYRAGWSRFTQADPLMTLPRVSGATDGYLYVDGRPLRFTDPSGLLVWDPSCDACASPANMDPKYREQLQMEQELVCQTVDWWITDRALADCMKRRCRDSVVKCDGNCGPSISGSGTPPIAKGTFLPPDSTEQGVITICTNRRNAPMLPGSGAVIMLHEIAHNCGWNDRGGKGVPDPYVRTYEEDIKRLGLSQ